MPSKNWSEDHRLKHSLGVNSPAISELYTLLIAAGCETVSAKFYLPNGEEQTFTTLEELNELGKYEFQQATKIGISGRAADTEIFIFLSRDRYTPSFYSSSGTDRNKLYVLSGISEDFEQKFSTSDAIQSGDFVSVGVFGLSPKAQEGSPISGNLDLKGIENIPAATEIGISKKIRKIPDELPDAKIYLDDLEEISNILLEVYRQHRDSYDPEPAIVYLIGDEEFSSLSALRSRGGNSRKLAVTICGRTFQSVRINGVLPPNVNLTGLDDPIKWMVYGRVKSIFDSRAYKFKNAIRSLPMWFKVIVYVAWLSSLHFIDVIPLRTRTVTAFVIYLIIPALVGLEVFHRSVVVFSPSHKASGVWTERRIGYVQNILFALLGAALSVLFQALYDRIKGR